MARTEEKLFSCFKHLQLWKELWRLCFGSYILEIAKHTKRSKHGIHFGISFFFYCPAKAFLCSTTLFLFFAVMLFVVVCVFCSLSTTTSIAKVLGKRKCTSFLKSTRKMPSVNNYFEYFVLFFFCYFFFCPSSQSSYLETDVFCRSIGEFCGKRDENSVGFRCVEFGWVHQSRIRFGGWSRHLFDRVSCSSDSFACFSSLSLCMRSVYAINEYKIRNRGSLSLF